MKNNYTLIENSLKNQLLDLEIVKLVFSKSFEKYEHNRIIIDKATDMNSFEKLEAQNRNYNNLRKEIIENSIGAFVGVLVLITAQKIIFLTNDETGKVLSRISLSNKKKL